uniref:Uncharacterized protein n=1 Tax=Tanacetum cinerariifolium TaxID=118510 RepID=A0A6L2P917_TANCI|nr:hypothetical protein [Tanacetum cinerariifolium]
MRADPFTIHHREEIAQPESPSSSVPLAVIREFYEKNYEQLLSFMAKKAYNEKLKDVRSRVGGQKEKRAARVVSFTSFLIESVFSRLGAKRQEQRRKDARKLIRSYDTCSSERQGENGREYRHRKKETLRDEALESEDSVEGRHWKRRSRIAPRGANDDLSEPYNEESTTLLTRRINEFIFPKRIRMPTTVKTYDGA